jgi:hypothetical protein
MIPIAVRNITEKNSMVLSSMIDAIDTFLVDALAIKMRVASLPICEDGVSWLTECPLILAKNR